MDMAMLKNTDALKKWVSEQFLNGTSAHYRLFSATNGEQQENKYVTIRRANHKERDTTC